MSTDSSIPRGLIFAFEIDLCVSTLKRLARLGSGNKRGK
jgi:hypothetical protein